MPTTELAAFLEAAGETVQNVLRATHVYRREADGWKIIHRHGDHMAEDSRP
jgi:ketosteroid isomerase-like protein